MTGAVLEASGVVKTFGQGALSARILHGIDLTIHAGDLTLLMGPSGSGKTTLVSILAGLMRPTSGRVELCGVRISDLPDHAVARLRRERMGFIFQTYNLFPALTALHNVALAYEMRGDTRAVARARARAGLDRVGLGAQAERKPSDLSSGQKQRVAIARALAGDPQVIVGDEPTAALDTENAMAVMELVRSQILPSVGVLLVTHDHRLERFADRVVAIEDGRIVRDERMHPLAERGAA